MDSLRPIAKILSMIPGMLLIVPGAFMVVDGILVMLGNNAIFFNNLDYKFEFVVGYALIMLGASKLEHPLAGR